MKQTKRETPHSRHEELLVFPKLYFEPEGFKSIDAIISSEVLSHEPYREDIKYAQVFSSIQKRLRKIEDAVRIEGEATREHVSAVSLAERENIKKFIRLENLTVIDCIKYNAVRNIQVISLFGASVFLFSLALSLTLKVHIINPFYAILALVGSAGFYFMSKIEEIIKKF